MIKNAISNISLLYALNIILYAVTPVYLESFGKKKEIRIIQISRYRSFLKHTHAIFFLFSKYLDRKKIIVD